MAANTISDEDALRIGRAVETLRRRVGVSQAQAAAAHDPPITPQYWAKFESGRVSGIFRPAIREKMIAALNAAGQPEHPLTPDDLDEIIAGGRVAAESRMARIAREVGGEPPPAREPVDEGRRLIFPTRDGDVVFVLPSEMTPKGYRQLERLWAVFLANELDDEDDAPKA